MRRTAGALGFGRLPAVTAGITTSSCLSVRKNGRRAGLLTFKLDSGGDLGKGISFERSQVATGIAWDHSSSARGFADQLCSVLR